MKIQIHSDIHLEKYPYRRLEPKASTLILAGDIGVPLYPSYKTFFADTSKSFDKIYYVLGNHEYERAWKGIDKNNTELIHQRFQERNRMIKDIISCYPNVQILDNQYTNINNKLVYGGTLWTHFRECIQTKHYLAQQHKQFYDKMTIMPHLLITHYVSCRSALKKPWSVGLGPEKDIPTSNHIFGHIHYPIVSETVNANPWGDRPTTEPRVWAIKN